MPIIINTTSSEIKLNDGTIFPKSEFVSKIDTYTEIQVKDHPCGLRVDNLVFGEIIGIPNETPGIFYIVSAKILAANYASLEPRKDLLSPASDHRNCVYDNNILVSVPHFISQL